MNRQAAGWWKKEGKPKSIGNAKIPTTPGQERRDELLRKEGDKNMDEEYSTYSTGRKEIKCYRRSLRTNERDNVKRKAQSEKSAVQNEIWERDNAHRPKCARNQRTEAKDEASETKSNSKKL